MTEEQAPAGDEQLHDDAWGGATPSGPAVFHPEEGVGAAPTSFFGGVAAAATGADDDAWQPPAIAAYEPYYGAPGESWSTGRFESIMRDTIDAQAQEQKQLEELLRDVRTALVALPAPEALAQASAAQTALGAQVGQLAADLAAARTEQAQQLAALAARVEELSSPAPATGASEIQDLHDGLAGVRTDLASMPDQIGPAVTSAVAHGLSGTASQVGAVQEALAVLPAVVAETAELRALVAEQAGHLALLPLAVADLRDLNERVAGLQGAVADEPASVPSESEIAAAVDELVSRRLGELGATLSRQLDAVAQRVDALQAEVLAAVDAAAPGGGSELDPAALDLDGRFGALHEELREMRLAAEGPTAATAAVEDRVVAVQEDLRAMRLATEGPASPDAALVALLLASEQRLAHHVDEAVLALAQAVLRRRAVAPPAYVGSSPLVPGSDGAAPVFAPVPIGIDEAADVPPAAPAPPAPPATLHDDLTDATAAQPPTDGGPDAVEAADDADEAGEGEGGDRLTGVLEAWAKGDPATHVESDTGWPGSPSWPIDPSHDSDTATDAPADDAGDGLDADEGSDDDGFQMVVPSHDVLPGRHRPGGPKRGLFHRRG